MANEAATKGASDLLRTLANPQRLKILSELAAGEMSVGDLQAHIALTQSALSQHLARLRAQNLVATRRQAQTIYYRIVDDEALAMAHALLRLVARRAKEVG
jgi:DNA-binding transcriptional ArsR family regulator